MIELEILVLEVWEFLANLVLREDLQGLLSWDLRQIVLQDLKALLFLLSDESLLVSFVNAPHFFVVLCGRARSKQLLQQDHLLVVALGCIDLLLDLHSVFEHLRLVGQFLFFDSHRMLDIFTHGYLFLNSHLLYFILGNLRIQSLQDPLDPELLILDLIQGTLFELLVRTEML